MGIACTLLRGWYEIIQVELTVGLAHRLGQDGQVAGVSSWAVQTQELGRQQV